MGRSRTAMHRTVFATTPCWRAPSLERPAGGVVSGTLVTKTLVIAGDAGMHTTETG